MILEQIEKRTPISKLIGSISIIPFIYFALTDDNTTTVVSKLLCTILLVTPFLVVYNGLKNAKLISNAYLLFLLLFALILTSVPLIDINLQSLFGVNLVVFSIFLLLKVKLEGSVNRLIFSSSLLLSIAFITHPTFLLYLLIPFYLILILRVFNHREHIVIIIGFCTPLIYYFTYNYLFDIERSLLKDFAFLNPLNNLEALTPLFCLLITLAIVASTYVLSNRGQKLILQQKQTLLIFGLALLSVLQTSFMNVSLAIPIIAISFGFFLTIYLQQISKKWLSNTLVAVLLISKIILEIIS